MYHQQQTVQLFVNHQLHPYQLVTRIKHDIYTELHTLINVINKTSRLKIYNSRGFRDSSNIFSVKLSVLAFNDAVKVKLLLIYSF